MAIIRSIIIALFVIGSLCPSLATAQDVYEVRTSSDDYVIIGTHERGATLNEVVALAQRLTGNETLTSEDVLANVPHARRYICRVHGRQVYFGTDPSPDRCPDGATRADGILGGTRYRVPRTHGAVLPPLTVHRTRATVTMDDVEAANDRALEYVRELERMTIERDAARAELAERRTVESGYSESAEELLAVEHANRELRAENAELIEELAASRATTVPTPVLTVQPVTLQSSFHGRPLWGVFLVGVMLLIALFLILLWPLRRAFRQPLEEQLADNRTTLRVWEGDLRKEEEKRKDAQKELKEEQEKLKEEQERTASLVKRRERLTRATVFYRGLHQTSEKALAAALNSLQPLQDFRARKERIAEQALLLAELRDQEEPFLDAELLLQEAMEGLQDAQTREDAEDIRQQGELVRIYEENLKSLGDPTDIRAQIATLSTAMELDLAEQCGLKPSSRPGDERFGEWERTRRDHLRKAEVAKRAREELVAVVEKQGLAALEEHAKRKREVDSFLVRREAELDGQSQAKIWMIASSKQDVTSDLARERRLHAKTRLDLAAAQQVMAELRSQNEENDSLLRAALGDPDDHAKALIARDTRIVELEVKCREANIDPGIGPRLTAEFWAESPVRVSSVPSNGAAHARVPTLGVAAPAGERPSTLPGATSPGNAINTALYRFLDTASALPPELRIIHCNEREARDWAFLFGQWTVTVNAGWDGADQPRSTRDIPLRELGKVVKRFFPEWLQERGRRKTNPPGAPAPT